MGTTLEPVTDRGHLTLLADRRTIFSRDNHRGQPYQELRLAHSSSLSSAGPSIQVGVKSQPPSAPTRTVSLQDFASFQPSHLTFIITNLTNPSIAKHQMNLVRDHPLLTYGAVAISWKATNFGCWYHPGCIFEADYGVIRRHSRGMVTCTGGTKLLLIHEILWSSSRIQSRHGGLTTGSQERYTKASPGSRLSKGGFREGTWTLPQEWMCSSGIQMVFLVFHW